MPEDFHPEYGNINFGSEGIEVVMKTILKTKELKYNGKENESKKSTEMSFVNLDDSNILNENTFLKL